jgi:uncharacterized protein (TIGR00251 family)
VTPDFPFLKRDTAGSVFIDVHVIPNARRTHADGMHDGALRVRLHAPPVDGKANQALVQWLAQTLGIAKSHVSLARGHTSKRKQLLVSAGAAAEAQWQHLTPAQDA